MEPEITRRGAVFSSWLGLAFAVGAAIVLLWFFGKIVTALLMLFFAIVVAIALSAGVNWFIRRGLPRRRAAGLTLILFFAVFLMLSAIVIPRLAGQVVALARELPALALRIEGQLAAWLAQYPDLHQFVRMDGSTAQAFPSMIELLRGFGGVSLSLMAGLALALIFFSTVAYIVLDPRPLIRAYYQSLPAVHRRAGMRAYRRAAAAIVGWTEASLVVGALQAILVFAFLTWMQVPGALIWAVLAFFSDFIPRIGGFIMAVPPVLLSLALGPWTVVWVALFYVVSNELLGTIVAPKIRASRMKLHPVLLIFFTLAFALAFGLLGAIVATPAAAFASAYYSEFYLRRPLPPETA
ncbi:MAG: AI-2E family transporter [Sphingosinicella sp.]